VRDALKAAQDETAGCAAGAQASAGDAATTARLRAQLDAAERRQRVLGGVDYRAISHKNQDAVAIVLVEYTDGERFSGTAFAVDSQGTMVTNKHILTGEDGTKTPRRLGVIFSGSTQFWQAEVVGVSAETDVGVFRVTIKGGTPRVAGLARTRDGLERGDPVAILGYPLGFDLPMESRGGQPIAEPSLTVGTVSKALRAVVQVDAYGAPGSSGSPVFDRDGKVIGVLYGGERESNGKIIFAVPAYVVTDYLKPQSPALGSRRSASRCFASSRSAKSTRSSSSATRFCIISRFCRSSPIVIGCQQSATTAAAAATSPRSRARSEWR
jgi:S1-C subfamily serine protease